ncbi:MAG: conjugal transfer protein TraL [Oscillospiraceae bacterium]
MDSRVVIILLAEAVFCLLLLYFEGLLKKPEHIIISAVLIVAAFGIRYACLGHVTHDYTDFLSKWVQFFRENGGFAALSRPIGNYNVPYLYFLALFSYSEISDLYLIKLLSVFFDIILAWACTRLAWHFVKDRGRLLFCFFGVLFLPTVILNGAYWGQCDSIYAAFAVLSVYLALERQPELAMVSIAVSFAFKLQAVFIMPLFVVFWLTGRIKLPHFLLFPLTYLALVLPAVVAGRPLWDTVTLYFSQMGSVGGGLNYNSPSIFAFVRGDLNPELCSVLGVLAAALFVVLVFILFRSRRNRASDTTLLAAALLFAVAVPFLLPHMHDRYFFVADILSLCFAVAFPQYFILPLLIQFASFNSYYAYLRGSYLLYMPYGAWAMLLAIALLLIFVSVQLRDAHPRRM